MAIQPEITRYRLATSDDVKVHGDNIALLVHKDGGYIRWVDHERALTTANERIKELAKELGEQDSSFLLRWEADQRAIKRWQEATGKELTWPDHADLCVWLLEQNEALRASLRAKAERMKSDAIICHQEPPCDGCKALMEQRDEYADELLRAMEGE